MTNAELITALRNCSSAEGTCAECLYRSRVYPGTCNGCKWDMMRDAADALEAADKRIAELERQLLKEGEWEKAKPKGIVSYSDGYAECSNCHDTIWLGWKMHYCPNCGARMKTVTNCHTLWRANDEQ